MFMSCSSKRRLSSMSTLSHIPIHFAYYLHIFTYHCLSACPVTTHTQQCKNMHIDFEEIGSDLSLSRFASSVHATNSIELQGHVSDSLNEVLFSGELYFWTPFFSYVSISVLSALLCS